MAAPVISQRFETLANRLSADGRYGVALIEAGGPDSYRWIHIPVGYFKTMGHAKFDWRYKTQPDDGLNGRSIAWPRGKTLGGSSSINGLLYVRGQDRDFDVWRQMGNVGWAWEDVLPYFRKSETWELNNSPLRGSDGPIRFALGLYEQSVFLYVEVTDRALVFAGPGAAALEGNGGAGAPATL